MSNKIPFWIKPGMARNFYFGEFWFETGRFAYGFKPNILLEAIRNPAGGRPAWVMKFRFCLDLEWRGIFTSGNLGLKQAVLPMVSSPKILLDAVRNPACEMKSRLRNEVQAAE